MTHDTTTSQDLTVGALRAEPGAKTRGTVAVDLGPVTVDVPVILVNGARPGPRVVLTGGVHGGEFIGVAAASQLANLLRPEQVSGQVVICPVSNPPAVYQGRLGISPLDGVNINRIFPGDPAGGPTQRMAAWLFENLLAGADAYADLHSGGIDGFLLDFVGYRLTADPELDAKTRDMAHAVGYERVVLGTDASGGNSHAAAARRGIPAILIETGQGGDREATTVRRLLDGLHRLLHHLGITDPEDTEPTGQATAPRREWVWAAFVESPASGLWFPDFAPGDDVTEGQSIGRVLDPLDGTEHKVTADATGRILYGMTGLTVAPGAELAAIAAPAPQNADG
ncbi:succinylglutamate desuccinylase/aspartoacylase family protein [Streptomyces sp. GESEQ-35]|uniref:succinylglutamate desuccinylase/aspartoacylase family protein n=1 Tax=Streptomyces sp. GESEQ-35 TaxID=2812657 RepID=UPI001B32DC50|nr:succinylglutamate desuccinylase/aspartoacylase family protein [Streptomyces sp. GESEQ-35]